MRLFITIALMATLVTPVFAEPGEPTGLPGPTPSITEFTIIQGAGWSNESSTTASSACNIAHERAISQLNRGIAVARRQGFVTTDALSHAVLNPERQVWNTKTRQCLVYMELAAPVRPTTRAITMVHERQY